MLKCIQRIICYCLDAQLQQKWLWLTMENFGIFVKLIMYSNNVCINALNEFGFISFAFKGDFLFTNIKLNTETHGLCSLQHSY